MPEESSITCPKAPTEEIMRMLIRANQFLNHAKEHALSSTEFDVMISIHNLDNALEYILRILIKHFDIESVAGKSVETSEIDQLIGIISKFFDENSLPALPCVSDIKLIRKQRNLVQHAITNPASEMKIYIANGEKFLSRVLNRYFGIQLSDLHFSTLIEDHFVKSLIARAEQKIADKKYIEAIVDVRDAFDYATFQNSLYRHGKLSSGPAIVEARNGGAEIPPFLEHIHDTLWMTALSVDMGKYNRYLEYTKYIPYEYCKGHAIQYVLQRSWEKRDADFCYLFVCNTLLHWQSMDTSDIDPRDDNVVFFPNSEFTDLIEGVDIRETFESKGCAYGLNQHMGKLFFVNSEEKLLRIKTGSERGFLKQTFRRTENGVLRFSHSSIIRSLGMDWKLAMNNPETWQVFLLFDAVPFTEKDELSEQTDIDNMTEDDEYSEIILPFLPLMTMEVAQALEERLKAEGIDPNQYYSSKLIEELIR